MYFRSFPTRTRCVAAGSLLALFLFLGVPLAAQRPPQNDLIVQYLARTITWYRDISTLAQSPLDSNQVIFADGLLQSATETVRMAFEFARAQAAIPVAAAPQDASGGDAQSRTIAQSAAAAVQRADEAQSELDQINRQLQAASEKTRPKLLALHDEVASEVNFARARRDALRTLLGFLSAPDQGGLPARIAELERSVPELAAGRPGSAGAAPNRKATAQDFHPESAGIVGLTTQLFSVSQRMRSLDRLIQETDALRGAADQMRAPLRTALRAVIQQGDAVTLAADSADIPALIAEKKELDGLLARFKQLSASSAPLSEQATQIAASRGRLLEWHGALAATSSSALRYLVLRTGMLAVALLVIFALSGVWRRATMRYVQDPRRRRQFLLFRRIMVGCAVALLVVLSFVTEFGSLATFAGFATAGIAVAMQSVILSVVAYFFLVGRWGVRVGDRVTVSGVTGEVADVGLFRLYLMELSGSGLALQPTGRLVVFPNAVFFQPAAMFKQLPGVEYVWRSVTVKVAGTADYAAVERQVLGAVESIFAEYRETVERQHKTVQSSLDLHTAAPHPESRVRLADSHLEISVRYPVEIRRAAEIEDRITRQLISQVDGGEALKIETAAG
jgi:small-conductance mechanosensitive channel